MRIRRMLAGASAALLGVALALTGAAGASASTSWAVVTSPNAGAQQGISCWSSTGCLSVGPSGR
ncbi:MAG: hypothetical protein ACLQDY_28070 [Streptosporangiaceae bacterium]